MQCTGMRQVYHLQTTQRFPSISLTLTLDWKDFYGEFAVDFNWLTNQQQITYSDTANCTIITDFPHNTLMILYCAVFKVVNVGSRLQYVSTITITITTITVKCVECVVQCIWKNLIIDWIMRYTVNQNILFILTISTFRSTSLHCN